MAKTPCSQCRGHKFDPWSGNEILHATTKDPTLCKKDGRSRGLQLRTGTAKYKFKKTNPQLSSQCVFIVVALVFQPTIPNNYQVRSRCSASQKPCPCHCPWASVLALDLVAGEVSSYGLSWASGPRWSHQWLSRHPVHGDCKQSLWSHDASVSGMSKVKLERSHNQYPLTFTLGIDGGEENTLFLQNEQFICNLEQGFLTSALLTCW